MDEFYVWITTRRIKPGALAGFEQAWSPKQHPDGMRKAYAYWTDDGEEVTGVSFWDSRAFCEAWRASADEARRREAMAPYIVDESEAFYRGRELTVPKG
jgi:heme-degrading monooxygenase HmoA